MENALTVLWTSSDRDTIENMIFMYTKNAKIRGWWENVTLVIWGGSARYIQINPEIIEKIQELIESGVHVSACRACADKVGVTSALEEAGVEVKYWGEPLTEILKSGAKLLSV